MKKILFTCLRMNVGGIEKAMIGLMNALDPAEYDIHLGLIFIEGGLLDLIPEHVKVHRLGALTEYADIVECPRRNIPRRIMHGEWRLAVPALWHYMLAQSRKTLAPYISWLLRDNRPGGRFADTDLDGEFDLAIDFPGFPGEYLGYYVNRHIRAKRRATWVHFDLDRVHMRPRSAREIYGETDRIFCVSDKAREQVITRHPQYAEKTAIFHNIIDIKGIMQLGDVASDYTAAPGCLNIVTVGRTTVQKGQDIALAALKILLDRGEKVFWHFAGYGPEFEKFNELARTTGVDAHCRFYGAQTNPYPFMKAADLYVQPSRFEGYGITLAEAKVFGLPIVATDFVGASEQLAGISNARIIDNFVADDELHQEDALRLAEAILAHKNAPRITPDLHALTNNAELQSFRDFIDGKSHS